jgi:DNA (cytosine-5)-methyltransferase 1
MRSIEICAGAGGQALGLEMAGFEHVALIEIDTFACNTLKQNRPNWNVIQTDLKDYSAKSLERIDLLAGGVPCPPFSVAGKQLGNNDERDLFPEAIRMVRECQPKAVMLENVRGLFDPKFKDYRTLIIHQLENLGYDCSWQLVRANDFGVPQLRPRTVLVAMKREYFKNFQWPKVNTSITNSVGDTLLSEMEMNGWEKAKEWAEIATGVAPTLVGGSKKHGGADLGPTRTKLAWLKIGVDAKGLADAPPPIGFTGIPRLTIEMTALLQGFPKTWKFTGKKTAAYRQIGNAFPPPVAKAIGEAIFHAIEVTEQKNDREDYCYEKLGIAR